MAHFPFLIFNSSFSIFKKMYDNFSDREYALVDAYLAGTLQAEERSELNAAARNNAVLYEYIVLRKQLQYIGKQRSLVSAALLVQADLDLPMPQPAPKPHFVQYKFAYAGIAASFLAAFGFFFWSQDFSLGKDLGTLVSDATVSAKNLSDLKTEKVNTKINAIVADANTNFYSKNAKNAGKNASVKQKNASDNIFTAPVKQKTASKNILTAPVKQKTASKNILTAPVKQKNASNNILTAPDNILNAKNNVDAPKKWNTLAKNGVIGSETLVTDAPIKATTEVSTATKAVTETSAPTTTELPAPAKSASSSVITYFKKHFPKKANGEQYVFNTATDTLFVTPQGTVIALPKNVFATTEPRLTLTVKEAYTYGDMLLHQLTTVADNDNLMETGGMLYLQATDKTGKDVPLKPNKTIKVQMPSTNLKADMQSFYQSKTDKAEVFENAAAWSAASAGNLEKKNVKKKKLELKIADKKLEKKKEKKDKEKGEEKKDEFYWKNSRLNILLWLEDTATSIRRNDFGQGFDYDCAVCMEAYNHKKDIFYFMKEGAYVYSLGNYVSAKDCKKYWQKPEKMIQEVDSLKKVYNTKNIRVIIHRQNMARKRKTKQDVLQKFNAYAKMYDIKDSTAFLNTIYAFHWYNEKNTTKWIAFLQKCYNVKDEAGLRQKIEWEDENRDSIDLEDWKRYYNTQDTALAKKMGLEQYRWNSVYRTNPTFWFTLKEYSSFELFFMRLFRIKSKKKGNIAMSSPGKMGNTKQDSITVLLNTAVADLSELGWVNMDRFMGLPNLTALKPANPEKAHIVAIFKNYKCILGVSDDLNPYARSKGAPRVPRNEPITLIAYKVEGEKFFIGKIETTTSNAKTAPVMQEISSESLDKVLAGL
jgi:hypothetical protein